MNPQAATAAGRGLLACQACEFVSKARAPLELKDGARDAAQSCMFANRTALQGHGHFCLPR
ncbi:MAG: hypothetical protein V7642_4769 [Burkholderiales bacterium]